MEINSTIFFILFRNKYLKVKNSALKRDSDNILNHVFEKIIFQAKKKVKRNEIVCGFSYTYTSTSYKRIMYCGKGRNGINRQATNWIDNFIYVMEPQKENYVKGITTLVISSISFRNFTSFNFTSVDIFVIKLKAYWEANFIFPVSNDMGAAAGSNDFLWISNGAGKFFILLYARVNK